MCTRVVYLGPEDTIITARSMDWKKDMGTKTSGHFHEAWSVMERLDLTPLNGLPSIVKLH